ncbi:hypothetical protein [Paenibacillus xanthanilyticus]|uniref:Lipoprotein n=1 Tax=Paenibacillus xanthanilyticus TaxID=1783531 RepID=A0ABV8K6V8_9BACL
MKKLILLFLFCFSIVGCSQGGGNVDQGSKQLAEFYQGDFAKIDRIDIRNGATGETKSFTDRDKIQQWLDSIRVVEVQVDSNQEARTGYAYSAQFFEGEQQKIGFTTNQIGKVYFVPSEQLTDQLKSLFES